MKINKTVGEIILIIFLVLCVLGIFGQWVRSVVVFWVIFWFCYGFLKGIYKAIKKHIIEEYKKDHKED